MLGASNMITDAYKLFVKRPEEFLSLCFSSRVLVDVLYFLCPFEGQRLFFMSTYWFFCCKSDLRVPIINCLLSLLYFLRKTKETLMFSTKRPIFNIYYGLQLFLPTFNYNQQFDRSKLMNGEQVGADLTEICFKSVENLKFVLNHGIINKFIVKDWDFQKIGYLIHHHNITNCSDSLNGETTLLLLQELEQKYEKRFFEKIVFGFLRRAIYQHLDLFYFICDAFGDKYNVYECCHENLIIYSFGSEIHELNLFTYLLGRTKHMNLDTFAINIFSIFTLYGFALHYNHNVERTMLFSYGATPCFSFSDNSDFDLEYKRIQEDLLHGLLYCLHYRNVFVFL